MNSRNYIAEALTEHDKFITGINKATSQLFSDTQCETLFKSEKREIRAYRDDANAVIYLLDKQKNNIDVKISDIPYYNKEKSIKEIIHWDIIAKNIATKKTFNLYLPLIITCDLNKKEINKNLTEEQFEKNMLNSGSENDEKSILSFIACIKSMYGNNYLSNSTFFNAFFNKEVKCTSDVSTLQQYTHFLSNKGYMSSIESEFFKQLTVSAFSDTQPKLTDWVINIKAMLTSCKANQFISYQKAYVFNDLDNRVWINNDKLVISDQNLCFYVDIKNDNNFKIYALSKEYARDTKIIEKLEQAITNKTVNELKDVFLEVKEGQIIALNNAYTYCFELDVIYSVKSMKTDEVLRVTYPVDITSYAYQRDYYHYKFGLTEFEFIVQAMMTLGGGFDYDKEKGIFVNDNVTYIPNLPKAPNTPDIKIETFRYLSPKSISHLNKDWLTAIKFAVTVLKRDNPKPVVFYNAENEQDAVDKAIKYYELKIREIEKSNISK